MRQSIAFAISFLVLSTLSANVYPVHSLLPRIVTPHSAVSASSPAHSLHTKLPSNVDHSPQLVHRVKSPQNDDMAPSGVPKPKASPLKGMISASTQNLRILTSVHPTTQTHPPGFTSPSSSVSSTNLMNIASQLPYSNSFHSTTQSNLATSITFHTSKTTLGSLSTSIYSSRSSSSDIMTSTPSSIQSPFAIAGSASRSNVPSHGVIITLAVFGVLAATIVLTFLWSKDRRFCFCGGHDEHENIGDEEFDSFAGKQPSPGDPEKIAVDPPFAVLTTDREGAGGRSKLGGGRTRDGRKRVASHHLSISRPFAPGDRSYSGVDVSRDGKGRSTWMGWAPWKTDQLPPVPSHAALPPSIVVSTPESYPNEMYGIGNPSSHPSNPYNVSQNNEPELYSPSRHSQALAFDFYPHGRSKVVDSYSEYEDSGGDNEYWAPSRAR